MSHVENLSKDKQYEIALAIFCHMMTVTGIKKPRTFFQNKKVGEIAIAFLDMVCIYRVRNIFLTHDQ